MRVDRCAFVFRWCETLGTSFSWLNFIITSGVSFFLGGAYPIKVAAILFPLPVSKFFSLCIFQLCLKSPFLSWNLVSNNGQINSNAPLLTALKLNTWANECTTRIYLLQEFRYCEPRIRRWVCIAYSEGLRITNLAVDHVYSKGNLKDEGWHRLPFFCTEFVPGILGPQKTKKRSL